MGREGNLHLRLIIETLSFLWSGRGTGRRKKSRHPICLKVPHEQGPLIKEGEDWGVPSDAPGPKEFINNGREGLIQGRETGHLASSLLKNPKLF